MQFALYIGQTTYKQLQKLQYFDSGSNELLFDTGK